jgi:hypothetical protein
VFVRADLRWLLAAFLFMALNNLAKAARWKVLLGARGERVHFTKALVSHLAGQTLNTIFPARVGDLSRAYSIGGMGPGHVYVLGTVILEKVPDMIAFATLFLALLALMPLPGWLGSSGYTLVAVALVSCLAVAILVLRREAILRLLENGVNWLPQRLSVGVNEQVQSGFSALDALRNRWQLLKVTLWTGLIWLTALGINYLVFQSLALELPLTAALLLLLALQVGFLLPSVPGRIGVFEVICIVCLALFGVGRNEALGYGILLHAIIFLPMAVFGLAFWGLLDSDRRRVEENAAWLNPSEGDPL